MGKTSSIDRLEPEARAHLMKRMRERGLTLDELIADLRTTFPHLTVKDEEGKDKVPSRSSVGRYRKGLNSIVAYEREIAVASEALVAELGEGFDSKSGALLAQAMTTLATKRTFQALDAMNEGEDLDISDVLDLARAAKTVNEARGLSLKERRTMEAEAEKRARARLLEEQQANLDKIAKNQGMSQEQVDFWVRDFLGVR